MEKKRSVGVTIISLLIYLYYPTSLLAETIILKSGVKIEAKVLEKTDSYITIDYKGTPVRYNMYEIERIEESREPVSQKKQPSLKTDTDVIGSEEAKIFGLKAARYMQQGDYEKAIENFKKALELDRRCLPAYLGLGGCYLILGQHGKAIEISEEGLKNIPEYAWGMYLPMISAYSFQGNYEKAMQICDLYLKQFPDCPGNGIIYIALGKIYSNLGDYNKAKESFKKALVIAKKRGDTMVAGEASRDLNALSQLTSPAPR